MRFNKTVLVLFFSTVTKQYMLGVCPLCAIAVGAGVGFSKWLGIDDTITGLWMGALMMSLVLWTINFLNKHGIKFMFRKLLIMAAYYAPLIWYLHYKEFIGHPENTLWGIDKLLLGMIIGTILFVVTMCTYQALKERNNGHAWFPFQKIVMAVTTLLIASGIFYLITK
jgi:hypothetical protein